MNAEKICRIMLRNRPRASVTTTSKQASLMADQTPHPSPTYRKQIQFLFGSPRFRDCTVKALLDAADFVKSPTSVLDAKPFIANQAKPLNKSPAKRRNLDPERIGLAIIDALADDDWLAGDGKLSTFGPNNKRVLFGRKLRVEIPCVSPTGSPESPRDFGIKTRNLQSPSCFLQTRDSDSDSPSVFAGMELSEEYTCVISRGPNPKTTHIFDNYVVEVDSRHAADSVSGGFLSSYCHTCKKNLEPKADIFIYRGEKAFCSQDCRYQEMLLDGEES